jgi:CheY-like chemotaxis protein
MIEFKISNMIRVLIADDDRDDIEIFSSALEGVNVETELETVHDGAALLKRISDETRPKPDYLFLDLTMPKQSGFECLNHVRRNTDNDAIRIIILSDSVNVGEIDDAYDLGASHFITKPADINELSEQLLYIFKNRDSALPTRDKFVLRNHFYKKQPKEILSSGNDFVF